MENHGETRVISETSEADAADEERFPWFATRVICHWITERMKSDCTTYWNIDDYDGKVSYREESIPPPMEFAMDSNTTRNQYKQLRQELIALEEPDDDGMYEVLSDEQRKQQHNTTTAINNICKYQYNLQRTAHKDDAQLACFTKGQKERAPIGARNRSEEDEDEPESMMCQMTGENWEQLPFPIIIDSGACTSVMPTNWCPHVPTEETKESQAGEYFRAANGEKIFNEGRKSVSLMTREGIMRDIKFTSCEVAKALGSVSQICRAGHRVVFNPLWHEDGSCIEQVDTGEVMWLSEHNGLYVLDTKVAPTSRQTTAKGNLGFGRQAHP